MATDSTSGETGTNSSHEGDSVERLWVAATSEIVNANATSWFQDLGTKTVQELFERQVAAQQLDHSHSAFFSGRVEGTIVPSMEVDLETLGEAQVIENTELGRAVIAELKSRGVTFSFVDSVPLNHFSSLQLEVKDELIGQWDTDFGSPFLHHFKVFKDNDGKETGFWFAHLLATAVPLTASNEFEIDTEEGYRSYTISEEQLADGMLSYGAVSTKVHLPILLKNIAYLGETPLPGSQLMSLSRDLAFKDVPKPSRPTPTFSILKDSSFLSHAPANEETGEASSYKGQIVPELVVFGWRFGIESLDFVSSFLPTIVDGCTRAVSTVDVGYKFYSAKDSPLNYDSLLSNPCSYLPDFDGSNRLARAQWLPVTELGALVSVCDQKIRRAKQLLNSNERDAAWNEYMQIVNGGVGWYIASAINSLEYHWHIPALVDNPAGLVESEYFLKLAISLNVLNESTNALINLGLARMMVGDYESAEKILYGALERPDKFGTAEIQYYRSLICAKQGDRGGQMLLANLVKDLGGFLSPAYIEEALNLGKTNAPDSMSARPQNCGICGTQFESEEINFCGSCGVGREEVSISGQ